MAEGSLKTAIKEKNIPGSVLLYGPEEYQKGFFRKKVLSTVIGGEEDQFSHLVLAGRDFSLDALEDAVESVGFFLGGRVVELPNLEFPKLSESDRKRLISLLGQVPEGTVVLFVYDSLFLKKDDYRKYKVLMEAVKKVGILEEVVEPTRAALRQWVCKQFAFYKKEISPETAFYLMDYTDGTMATLKQESEKIAGYAKGSVITKEDIMRVCTKSQRAHIFDVTNAIVTGDYDKVLSLISELREKREEPIALISVLSSTFSELYFTKACLKDGIVGSEQIGAAMGMAPNRRFLVKRYLPMAQRSDIVFLRRCVEACMEADADLKGSRVDKWQRIERLIGTMLLAADKSAKRIK